MASSSSIAASGCSTVIQPGRGRIDDRYSASGMVCLGTGRSRGSGIRGAGEPSRFDGLPCLLVHSTVRNRIRFHGGRYDGRARAGRFDFHVNNRLKLAAVLLLLAIGSTYWTWRALAVAVDEKGHERLNQVDGRPPPTVPSPGQEQHRSPPPAVYRLTGSVRLEGTGEPIARARLEIVPEMSTFGNPSEMSLKPALTAGSPLMSRLETYESGSATLRPAIWLRAYKMPRRI